MECILTLTKVNIDKCFNNMSEASCSQMQSVKEKRERNVICIVINYLKCYIWKIPKREPQKREREQLTAVKPSTKKNHFCSISFEVVSPPPNFIPEKAFKKNSRWILSTNNFPIAVFGGVIEGSKCFLQQKTKLINFFYLNQETPVYL